VQIVIVAAVAWVVGIATYFAALLLLYGERLAWSGDTKAALFWSALAFGVLFFVLYVPVLRGIRRMLHGVKPLWPFPLAARSLGVFPAALIAFLGGGNLSSLMSHEAFLFYLMFAAIGVVVGVGFVVLSRNASA
jgi:hypothetical protein